MQVFLTFLLTAIYLATHLNGSDLRLKIREFKQPPGNSIVIHNTFVFKLWLIETRPYRNTSCSPLFAKISNLAKRLADS